MTARSPTEVARAPSRARSIRAFALGCSATLTLALAAVATLVLARDFLLTQVAAHVLSSRGIACSGLSLRTSLRGDEVTIAPASCAFVEGPLSEVAWSTPAVLTLRGLEISSIRLPEARLTHRTARSEPNQTYEDLLRAPSRIGALLHVAASLYAFATPHFASPRIEFADSSAVEPAFVLTDVVAPSRRPLTPVEVTVGRIVLSSIRAPFGASATPSLEDVRISTDSSAGSLTGIVDARLDVPGVAGVALGRLLGRRQLTITARNLDGPSPNWTVSLNAP